jgi:transcriptional regulator with XRE-family HTH domain
VTPSEFKAWRKGLGLRQKEAAERLGLKKRVIQYYERGHRDGKKLAIPKAIELACYAVANGIDSYDGGIPGKAVSGKPRKSAK